MKLGEGMVEIWACEEIKIGKFMMSFLKLFNDDDEEEGSKVVVVV